MRRQNRRLLTLGLLLIAAVVLLAVGRQSDALRPAVSVAMTPLRPVVNLVRGGAEAVVDLTRERESYASLEARMLELERTVAELQVELVRLREIEQDYYRLSGLVEYAASRPDQRLVTADVIAMDTSGYLRWIIINRGTRDGIRVGNPVVSDLGLVGRVEDVAANASWVRLAIDQGSAIDARLQNARTEGTLRGQLLGGMRMEIPREAAVAPGDLVLTSGLGGTFPPNIVIGQVASVRRQQAALFQEAEVRPTVNFDNLRIVSVVTGFEPIDIRIFEESLREAGAEGP